MVNREIKVSNNQKKDLSIFFDPKSIAIIGSLRDPWSGGRALSNNLYDWGYQGKVYFVNPSYKEVDGVEIYPTIKSIPKTVDLAIVITPASTVPDIVRDCAEVGIKNVIIMSDGFAERDEGGENLQKEIINITKRTGIQIIGPNTAGIANGVTGLVISQYPLGSKIKRGCMAFASQTGVISATGFPYGDLGYGVSKICDFGNKCEVDESDLLEYLADDPETKVIAMEIEGIRDGRRFFDTAKRVTREKPILIFKPGRTKESSNTLMSHTGSLAGDQNVYKCAFKQAGIIQVNSFRELLEIAKAFSYQPLPKGNRLGIITITGAGGIIAIDTAVECGLALAKLSMRTNEKLFKIHPTLTGNPSDIGQMAGMGIPPYKEVIEAILNDENVDCLLCTIWSFLPAELYIQALNEAIIPKNKPIIFWVYGGSLENTNQICFELENNRYPVYSDIEIAIKTFGAMYQYMKIRTRFK